jgi:hypothetical protein
MEKKKAELKKVKKKLLVNNQRLLLLISMSHLIPGLKCHIIVLFLQFTINN